MTPGATWMDLPPEAGDRREALFGGRGAVRVWELLPDGPAGPFTAALACELDPGGSVGAHVQARDDEVVVCIEGHGDATVGDAVWELAPGAAVYLPRGATLALRNGSGAAPLRYLIVKAAPR